MFACVNCLKINFKKEKCCKNQVLDSKWEGFFILKPNKVLEKVFNRIPGKYAIKFK